MKIQLCLLLILSAGIFASPAWSSDPQEALTQAAQNAVDILSSPPGGEIPTCGPTGTPSCTSSKSNFVESRLRQNRGQGLGTLLARVGGIPTPHQQCTQNRLKAIRDRFRNSSVLEAYFNNRSREVNSVPRPFFRECLEGQGSYSEEERKGIVSGYYYEMNRLQEGGIGRLESIGYYDALLGNKLSVWNNCPDSMPKAKRYCDFQRTQCQVNDRSEFNRIVADSKSHIAAYLREEEQLRTLNMRRCTLAHNFEGQVDENCQRGLETGKDRIKQRMGLMEANFPWFKRGTPFRQVFNENPTGGDAVFSNALRAQFTQDRLEMVKDWGEIKDAASCLQSLNGARNCNKTDRLLSSLPELNLPSGANNEMAHEVWIGQCLLEQRLLLKEGSEILNGLAINTVATIATVGAGAALTSTRSGALLARTSSIPTVHGRLSAIMGTNAGKVFASMVAMKGVSELYMANQDFRGVVESCSKSADAQAFNETGNIQNNQCAQIRLNSATQIAKRNMANCILSAGLAILPVAPGAISTVRIARQSPPLRVATRPVADPELVRRGTRAADQDVREEIDGLSKVFPEDVPHRPYLREVANNPDNPAAVVIHEIKDSLVGRSLTQIDDFLKSKDFIRIDTCVKSGRNTCLKVWKGVPPNRRLEDLPQTIYVHKSGVAVRIKPDGRPDLREEDIIPAIERRGSTEKGSKYQQEWWEPVRPDPHGSIMLVDPSSEGFEQAVEGLRTNPDPSFVDRYLSWQDEAAKVNIETGKPIPKAPGGAYIRPRPDLRSEDNYVSEAYSDRLADLAHWGVIR